MGVSFNKRPVFLAFRETLRGKDINVMVSLILVNFGTWPRTTSLPRIAIIVVVMFYVSYLPLLATIGLSINLPVCG